MFNSQSVGTIVAGFDVIVVATFIVGSAAVVRWCTMVPVLLCVHKVNTQITEPITLN